MSQLLMGQLDTVLLNRGGEDGPYFSKLPADVVSKSFQEVIIFAGHWALRHPLLPSRLASSSWFFTRYLYATLGCLSCWLLLWVFVV